MENQLLEDLVYATNNQLASLGKGDRLELSIDGELASIQRITPATSVRADGGGLYLNNMSKLFIVVNEPIDTVYNWVSGFVNALSF